MKKQKRMTRTGKQASKRKASRKQTASGTRVKNFTKNDLAQLLRTTFPEYTPEQIKWEVSRFRRRMMRALARHGTVTKDGSYEFPMPAEKDLPRIINHILQCRAYDDPEI